MNAPRDENRIPTLLGVDNIGFTLPTTVAVDPVTHEMLVKADINASEIQIGAVELKNATDDTRAVIKTDGTNNALVVTQNAQPLPTGASTAVKQLADNHNVTVSNIASTPVISGFATETTLGLINGKLVNGNDIGDVTINNTTANAVPVSGDVASGNTDSGNPVKVGGKYLVTSPTFTDGQRGDLQISSRGKLITQGSGELNVSNTGGAVMGGLLDSSGKLQAFRGAGFINVAQEIPLVTGIYVSNGSTSDMVKGIINATNSAGTGIAAVGLVGQLDDISPTAITENQFGNVRISAGRALLTQQLPEAIITYYPSSATSTVYAASQVGKASAGALFSLNGYNSKSSGQFIQVHNATSLPANTTAPVLTFYVPAQSNFSFDFPKGRWFATGITVANSSTGPTLTVGSADCWFDILYI